MQFFGVTHQSLFEQKSHQNQKKIEKNGKKNRQQPIHINFIILNKWMFVIQVIVIQQ